MKKRILITGVDRTGTSACAAVVHALGGNLIFDAGYLSEFNPHGYFEPVKLVLEGPGAYKQFVDANRDKPLWGVRNPRFCHFLNDFMDHFAPDEKVWVVYTWCNRERCRYPGHLQVDDLRDSLADQILKASVRGATIARVLYHDLFDNLDQVIKYLCARLELNPTPGQLKLARQAVDPTLRHFDFRKEPHDKGRVQEGP